MRWGEMGWEAPEGIKKQNKTKQMKKRLCLFVVSGMFGFTS